MEDEKNKKYKRGIKLRSASLNQKLQRKRMKKSMIKKCKRFKK